VHVARLLPAVGRRRAIDHAALEKQNHSFVTPGTLKE
jgi:hypothetical protein